MIKKMRSILPTARYNCWRNSPPVRYILCLHQTKTLLASYRYSQVPFDSCYRANRQVEFYTRSRRSNNTTPHLHARAIHFWFFKNCWKNTRITPLSFFQQLLKEMMIKIAKTSYKTLSRSNLLFTLHLLAFQHNF